MEEPFSAAGAALPKLPLKGFWHLQVANPVLIRGSQRLVLSVPVVVHRLSRERPGFYEGTRTLVVNAHGALVTLAANVAPDQRLVLQNVLSGEEEECRVVFREKKLAGPTEVAIEFKRPAPNFWHIAFPPPDWTPTH